MNITIIGEGNVGSALARGLTSAGHQVTNVGEDPAKVAQLAGSGDVVIIAVPFPAVPDVAKTIKQNVAGKTVIDVTNALTPEMSLAIGHTTSGAEELQKLLPDAKVVKAFNTTFAGTMDSGKVNDQQLTVLAASDHADAKDAVLGLARSIGFDAVDAGPLANARYLEPLGMLNIQLGYVIGLGTDIGFKLVHKA